jgi:hypothetical protein
MSFISEGRISDSPYIEMIWRGRAGDNYTPLCPADSRWNLLFLQYNDKLHISAEGPITKAKAKTLPEGTEWLVIKFKLGIFMPFLSIQNLLDGEAVLPLAANSSFWLHGSSWQLPNFDNVETFVAMLVRKGALLADPVVHAALQNQQQDISERTIRRRFLLATGLTPKTLEQIERAQYATALLQQGLAPLDVAYQSGYSDQPHMTRSLKHFIGYTPIQIAQMPPLE